MALKELPSSVEIQDESGKAILGCFIILFGRSPSREEAAELLASVIHLRNTLGLVYLRALGEDAWNRLQAGSPLFPVVPIPDGAAELLIPAQLRSKDE